MTKKGPGGHLYPTPCRSGTESELTFSLSQSLVLAQHHCACLLSRSVFDTPWTIAHQAPLSMGFSRQEYWNRLPFLSPGHLPDSGIEPVSLLSPALTDGFFTTSATWEASSPGPNSPLGNGCGQVLLNAFQLHPSGSPGDHSVVFPGQGRVLAPTKAVAAQGGHMNATFV